MSGYDTPHDETTRVTRRELLQRGAAGGLGLAAVGVAATLPDLEEIALAAESQQGRIARLLAAARKEGSLNVIALPRDWANYGEIMDRFKAKYNLSLTDAAPDDSSAQEIQAIISLNGQSRAPDVVDVSPTFAARGKSQGLFIPYKVATWSTIPASMRDPQGNWIGDYWGAISFLSVDNIVKTPPKDWKDLLKPAYKGMVAIDGDPRQAGDAFAAVMAASLANGGSLNDIGPGIDFYAKLKQVGNWNPTDAYPANISKGATPIAIKWDYLNLATRDELKKSGQAATVRIPKSGVYGGFYAQALSKSAPHPNAGKLWLEFLYSDEGQLLFLKGYTHPARYLDLAKRHKIPSSLAKKLPPASSYKHVKFATLAQIAKASTVLQQRWGSAMGG